MPEVYIRKPLSGSSIGEGWQPHTEVEFPGVFIDWERDRIVTRISLSLNDDYPPSLEGELLVFPLEGAAVYVRRREGKRSPELTKWWRSETLDGLKEKVFPFLKQEAKDKFISIEEEDLEKVWDALWKDVELVKPFYDQWHRVVTEARQRGELRPYGKDDECFLKEPGSQEELRIPYPSQDHPYYSQLTRSTEWVLSHMLAEKLGLEPREAYNLLQRVYGDVWVEEYYQKKKKGERGEMPTYSDVYNRIMGFLEKGEPDPETGMIYSSRLREEILDYARTAEFIEKDQTTSREITEKDLRAATAITTYLRGAEPKWYWMIESSNRQRRDMRVLRDSGVTRQGEEIGKLKRVSRKIASLLV